MLDVSIIVRAYNEARWLPELLAAIAAQDVPSEQREVILVDSGSNDDTVPIGLAHGCRVVHVPKAEFTFGRSLNDGCRVARGEFLVFVSAHCIPIGSTWLNRLLAPLRAGDVVYAYGRQQAHELTKFSERQLFAKYFPGESRVPQVGFFCNNANATLLRSIWQQFQFDEEITGLEDMDLAKRLVRSDLNIGYVADASVYHIHEESWSKIRTRYEREAIALQRIMPEVHIHFSDFLRYVTSGIFFDCAVALEERCLLQHFASIVMFRMMQFWGAYQGNNDHRRLSAELKHRYFYPR